MRLTVSDRFGARIGVLVMVCAMAAALGACGSGPRVSGLSFGNARFVTVGDTVTVRMPLGDDGSRQWRVQSFDSSFLTPEGRPHVEGSGRNAQLVLTARARLPGSTELVFVEVLSPTEQAQGKAPRTKRFKVEIVP